ncbi:MAG: carbohydrate ABC transporter permease [Candidatus Dormibacteraceae bacterium]
MTGADRAVSEGPLDSTIRPQRRGRGAQRRQKWGFLFILPILVLFVIFRFLPVLTAIVISLFRYGLLGTPTFDGLQNYLTLFRDPDFYQSLLATAYFVVGSCLPIWVLSLFLALLLNRKMRGMSFFRMAFFLPAIIPTVVLPVLWRFLYHPYGLINSLLETVGIPGVNWLGSAQAVIPGFILTISWRFIPLFMVIYLAGLQSIPQEIDEAARIDGASSMQRFFRITVPLLAPTILVVIITSVILTAKSLPLALLMTDGGPGNASRLLSLFIYQNAFVYYRMGYASAVSMVLLVILGTFTILLLRLNRDQA